MDHSFTIDPFLMKFKYALLVLLYLFSFEKTIKIYRNNPFDRMILNLIGLISYQFQKYLFLAF